MSESTTNTLLGILKINSTAAKTYIANKLSKKQDKLTFDTTPTANSSNPVTSNGIKSALNKKVDASSLKTVATTGSYNDLTNKPTIPTVPTKVSAFTNDAGYLTAHQDLSGYQTKLTFDTTPTANSTNPVTSGGIKTAIDSISVPEFTQEEIDDCIAAAGLTLNNADTTSY